MNEQVTKYIENSADFAKPILKHLREVIHKANPEIEEKIKWGNPHFDFKGPVCYFAAFKAHVIFGFWKTTLMKDPEGLFKVSKEAMGSLGRLTDVKQLPSDKILIDYIKEAIQLNIEGKKVVVHKHPKPPLKVPSFFTKILKEHKKAEEIFKSLSTSHKREYVEWITDAKTDETREKRIKKTLEMLKEGKSMNWKYEK